MSLSAPWPSDILERMARAVNEVQQRLHKAAQALEAGNVRVIVTEGCQTPNDPAYFRLHGIDPAAIPLLCVKAKNHFRAAFADMARCLVDVDCPGPASAGLFHYKFHHAPQNIW